MVKAKRECRTGMVAFSGTLIALALAWSLLSALNTGGHGIFGAERSAQHAAAGQAHLKADIKVAETELAVAGSPRAAVAIEAEIAAVLDDPRSGKCENLYTAWRKAECPKLTPLRKELGQAKARDAAQAKLAALRAKSAETRPVAEVEPAIEAAVKLARLFGYDLEPDTVRISRAVLYMIVLEFLKFGLAGWVAWLTPRSAPPEPPPVPESKAVAALPVPAAVREPEPQTPVLDPAVWLQEALSGAIALPPGIERRNGGLQGSYRAFGAAWGISGAKAQRLGQVWLASGRYQVETTSRGTWIGHPARQLRAVK
jgi:hypothetical protein